MHFYMSFCNTTCGKKCWLFKLNFGLFALNKKPKKKHTGNTYLLSLCCHLTWIESCYMKIFWNYFRVFWKVFLESIRNRMLLDRLWAPWADQEPITPKKMIRRRKMINLKSKDLFVFCLGVNNNSIRNVNFCPFFCISRLRVYKRIKLKHNEWIKKKYWFFFYFAWIHHSMI